MSKHRNHNSSNRFLSRMAGLLPGFSGKTTSSASVQKRRKSRQTSLEYGKLAKRELMAADLRGYDFDAPEDNQWGETIQIEGTVKNYGDSNAGGSYVAIYMSSDSTISNTDYFLGNKYISGINDGSRRDFTMNVRLPSNAPAGFTASDRVSIGMIVDAYNWVSESNEGNNSNRGNGRDKDRVDVESQGEADLVGTRFDADENLQWGKSFQVDARIKNDGTATAAGSRVRFYLSSGSNISSNDYYLGYQNIGSIAAGSTYYINNKTLTLPANPPSGFTANDTVYIGMIVDADNQVSESDEGNNRNEGTGDDRDRVTVQAGVAVQADLKGHHLYAQSSDVSWGGNVQLTHVQIRNSGQKASGGFYVQWYLSRDSQGSSDDILLRQTNGYSYKYHSGIGANSYGSMFSANLQLPSKPSNWNGSNFYIVMKTDAFNYVSESNENNNFGTAGYNDDRALITIQQKRDVHVGYVPFVSQRIGAHNNLCQFASGAMLLGQELGGSYASPNTMHELAIRATGDRMGRNGTDVYGAERAIRGFMSSRGISRSVSAGGISYDTLKNVLEDGNAVSVSLDYGNLGNYRASDQRHIDVDHQVVVTGFSETRGTWTILDPLQHQRTEIEVPSSVFRSAVMSYSSRAGNSSFVYSVYFN